MSLSWIGINKFVILKFKVVQTEECTAIMFFEFLEGVWAGYWVADILQNGDRLFSIKCSDTKKEIIENIIYNKTQKF